MQGLLSNELLSKSNLFGIITSLSLTAGDNIFAQSNTLVTTVTYTYTKFKEIKVNYGSSVRVKFDLSTADISSNAIAKIYVNDTAVGIERSTNSTSYITYSEDIEIKGGDYIQIYMKTSNGYSAQLKNFGLYCKELAQAQVIQ